MCAAGGEMGRQCAVSGGPYAPVFGAGRHIERRAPAREIG
ncbi:hypothetical protein BSIN_3624 [Burkholderia singularis]|uniref:Uncharacterized protein n=1 Tax=Burkholderia singularis TaxID=1503053 RepID=A0A238H5I8_9BURK|nr:hypothetical protein BSIN_3624 [Burkholderia singularis]